MMYSEVPLTENTNKCVNNTQYSSYWVGQISDLGDRWGLLDLQLTGDHLCG